MLYLNTVPFVRFWGVFFDWRLQILHYSKHFFSDIMELEHSHAISNSAHYLFFGFHILYHRASKEFKVVEMVPSFSLQLVQSLN